MLFPYLSQTDGYRHSRGKWLLKIFLGPETQRGKQTHSLGLHLESVRWSPGGLEVSEESGSAPEALTPAWQTEPCQGLLAKRDHGGGGKGHSQQLVWEIADKKAHRGRTCSIFSVWRESWRESPEPRSNRSRPTFPVCKWIWVACGHGTRYAKPVPGC